MSMQVFMNIFIIIISDSFSIIKERDKYDWLDEEELQNEDMKPRNNGDED